VNDDNLAGLLNAVGEGDLEAVLILCDLLEEQGDPRLEELRKVYAFLYDLWMFAPFSFRHFKVARNRVLPLFPEYGEG
jgi:hypothetical protein